MPDNYTVHSDMKTNDLRRFSCFHGHRCRRGVADRRSAEEAVTWGWQPISKTLWRFDARWTAEQDWASNRWYAVRDGKWLLADFADAGGAMAEADRLREADKDYEEKDGVA